ncbi:hypothetical protein NQ152_08540 [Microbacterium sp. zg.B48]|uniref:hypothetical protein n=1 Tax=unclassified Microbacterium TaxID=2609290 RepID=UPI00214B701C|nr:MULTISPECIES: hypothetical protein [unclassified Microbacterium]MCR2763556.1 hypothetical protein [Microbacterium sp. zg.B48]MCR2809278.1 hypothetical protein [Microbacterium sp. zg.B185]WIM20421.1 hypothetical protein QNO12_06390 [Microbacterium sp. zg-B185]
MPDPRRTTIAVGKLSIRPADAVDRWEVRGTAHDSVAVEGSWGEWVRLARRILDTDALSRDLEARGDAWDRGHAAGISDAGDGESANPYR